MCNAHVSTQSDRPNDWTRSIRRLVVKIGSRLLIDRNGQLNHAALQDLVRQMAMVRRRGIDVICVSSGAVAAGLPDLGRSTRPTELPALQAAAAIGQAVLAGLYRAAFADHGLAAAQILLTHDALRKRERHLNARNTLNYLLEAGVVPVINENDTVSVEEIRFGDNDMLSALVANLVRADALFLLTTADGFLSAPPGSSGGELLAHVRSIDASIRHAAGESADGLSTGGMKSKLDAVETVTKAGECTVIANGREADVLTRLLDGEPIGTLFSPQAGPLRGRQRWIAFFDHPRGDLIIDAGAARALRESGSSLLAAGILDVGGRFERGAPVRIGLADEDDGGMTIIARGLVNYAADDLRQIVGRRTDEIAGILGRCEFEAVVHRDNLVLLDEADR